MNNHSNATPSVEDAFQALDMDNYDNEPSDVVSRLLQVRCVAARGYSPPTFAAHALHHALHHLDASGNLCCTVALRLHYNLRVETPPALHGKHVHRWTLHKLSFRV
jgi:hypothetical protein